MLSKLFGFAILSIFGFARASASDVTCFSSKDAYAYYGDSGQWVLTFDLPLDDESITNVSMKTKAKPILGFTNVSSIPADPSFVAKNPKYATYNRFNEADAWCNYAFLLPKGLNVIEDKFEGQVYSRCESGVGGSFKVYCRKN